MKWQFVTLSAWPSPRSTDCFCWGRQKQFATTCRISGYPSSAGTWGVRSTRWRVSFTTGSTLVARRLGLFSVVRTSILHCNRGWWSTVTLLDCGECRQCAAAGTHISMLPHWGGGNQRKSGTSSGLRRRVRPFRLYRFNAVLPQETLQCLRTTQRASGPDRQGCVYERRPGFDSALRRADSTSCSSGASHMSWSRND